MTYTATGTAGNDTLNQSTDAGPGSIVGLGGNDSILAGSGPVTVDGGSGQDTVLLQTGNTGMVSGGTENDSIFSLDHIGAMVLFGNQGGDTILAFHSTSPLTILGGNDSADGNDCIGGGSGADIIFGHGGDDQLAAGDGNDTYVAGVGNDFLYDASGVSESNLAFGNEGNDTFILFGSNTVFAGQGNDFGLCQQCPRQFAVLHERGQRHRRWRDQHLRHDGHGRQRLRRRQRLRSGAAAAPTSSSVTVATIGSPPVMGMIPMSAASVTIFSTMQAAATWSSAMKATTASTCSSATAPCSPVRATIRPSATMSPAIRCTS